MTDTEIVTYLCNEHPILFKQLQEAFKREDVILRWLTTPKRPLKNKTPLEVLEIQPDLVKDMLHRIKTGDLS